MSQCIRQIKFLVLNADDELNGNSDIGLIEQNSVALLSHCTGSDDLAIEPPGNNWLDFNCNRPWIAIIFGRKKTTSTL